METVSAIIEEVKEEICEEYCKFTAAAEDTETLIEKYCEFCPLNRL